MRWNLTETGCQTPSGGRKPSPAGGKAVHGSKMGPVRLPDGPSLEAIWGMSVQTVARMPVARYRVVALCDAARRLIEWNNIVEGRRALDQALKDTALVEGEFATDFAWACVAEVFGLLGDNDKAQEAVGHINGKDMKARTLWRLAQLPLNVGSSAGASLEEAAVLATEATDTFKRVAIWCEAATEADRRGESDLARERIHRAIDIVANMKTRWWRARAISRIGAAFVTLETVATRR